MRCFGRWMRVSEEVGGCVRITSIVAGRYLVCRLELVGCSREVLYRLRKSKAIVFPYSRHSSFQIYGW